MSATIQTIDQAAGNVVTFSYTLPDGAAHALAAHPGCKRVRLIAQHATGTNSSDLYYGDANLQRDWLAADGSRDTYYHIDDSGKIYVKGTTGDAVDVRVEF